MPKLSALSLILACLSLAEAMPAQCRLQLRAVVGASSLDQSAAASWDRDGAGPLPAVLAIADNASDPSNWQVSARIRWFDSSTGRWSALPGIVHGQVWSMLGMANGDLVVAGNFTAIDTMPVGGIARWNGQAWSGLATGIVIPQPYAQGITALAELPNHDLIAAGGFTQSASGVAMNNIGRFDGTAWHALGSGTVAGGGCDSGVAALLVTANGDLLAGGYFNTADGVATGGLARWNGAAWTQVTPGIEGVTAMAAGPAADLYVTAGLNQSGPLCLRITSGGITVLGTLVMPAHCIAIDGNGGLLVGGTFDHVVTGSGQLVACQRIARWNGTTWAALPTIDANVEAVTGLVPLPGGAIAVTGRSISFYGAVQGVRRWQNGGWGVFGDGLDDLVAVMAQLSDGSLAVGGAFTWASGIRTGPLARWDGQRFWSIGDELDGVVTAMLVMRNGDLIVAGEFQHGGSVPLAGIGRWDGTAWHPLGNGAASAAACLLERPNGNLLVSGMFLVGQQWTTTLAEWNGTSWAPFPGVPAGTEIGQMAWDGAGNLLAEHRPPSVNSAAIMRWDGSSWHLVTPVVAISLLMARGNGDVTIQTNQLLQWRWQSGTVEQIGPGRWPCFELPNGDLITCNLWPQRYERFDGTNWHPFSLGPLGNASVFHMRKDGRLTAGNAWFVADQSSAFVELAPECPATAVAYGADCIGAGTASLEVDTLPWLGATFAATSHPTNPQLVLAVSGFAPLQLPLAALTPLALPGCAALVLPERLDTIVGTAGRARAQLPIPNSAAIVGADFFHQHLWLDFGPGNQLLTVRSSNALALRVGTW